MATIQCEKNRLFNSYLKLWHRTPLKWHCFRAERVSASLADKRPLSSGTVALHVCYLPLWQLGWLAGQRFCVIITTTITPMHIFCCLMAYSPASREFLHRQAIHHLASWKGIVAQCWLCAGLSQRRTSIGVTLFYLGWAATALCFNSWESYLYLFLYVILSVCFSLCVNADTILNSFTGGNIIILIRLYHFLCTRLIILFWMRFRTHASYYNYYLIYKSSLSDITKYLILFSAQLIYPQNDYNSW